jgi:hypothetical protein
METELEVYEPLRALTPRDPPKEPTLPDLRPTREELQRLYEFLDEDEGS